MKLAKRSNTWHADTVQQKVLSSMLFTSKNVLFPGPNHLLSISADDLRL